MACPYCKTWCATSEAQWENRLRNIANARQVQMHKCPKCGNIDWALAREFITSDGRPWYRRLASWALGDDRSRWL